METTKRLSDLDASDRLLVGKVFGHDLANDSDAVLILKTSDTAPQTKNQGDEVPSWCNVLEGLSDEELQEVNAIFAEPVRLAS